MSMQPRCVNKRQARKRVVAFTVMVVCGSGCAQGAMLLAANTLSSMSLEDLASIEITSVSKRPEPLSDAAAAIYVISSDDIRRSGATTLPEALRLAPNLQVARITSSNYSITARGFNSNTADKLLVMIDGRSIYTPLYSGVLWYMQDIPLDDVERIEVISGPGGTLWGANAVNGVINIITRSSADTQGGLLSAGRGNNEGDATLRYGGMAGGDASYRVYAKTQDIAETVGKNEQPQYNAFNRRQAGFRSDWTARGNAFTVQGDAYEGTLAQPFVGNARLSNSNMLARWSRVLSTSSNVQVQTYMERSRLDFPGALGEVLDTYDISAQHQWQHGMHNIVWGGGYRFTQDLVYNTAAIAFLPPDQDMPLTNTFVQDSIALAPSLLLTLGGKLEHNSFTGYENEPNARLAWKLSEHSLLWAAMSRAVRTPARLETDYHVPGNPPYILAGGPHYLSERLRAYEIGWRSQPVSRLTFSVSAYHNIYSRLRSYSNQGFPLQTVNNMLGTTSGLEAWAEYQATDWWRLKPGYNYLREVLHFQPGATDLLGFYQAADDPARQAFLRSEMNLPHDTELDLDARHIDALPYGGPKAYTELNARFAWHLRADTELALSGLNLLHPRHVEWGNTAANSEIERSVMLDVRYTF
jgi:iron complex outermembrane receptor protein